MGWKACVQTGAPEPLLLAVPLPELLVLPAPLELELPVPAEPLDDGSPPSPVNVPVVAGALEHAPTAMVMTAPTAPALALLFRMKRLRLRCSETDRVRERTMRHRILLISLLID
jgi:hypothetical protein